MDQPADQKPPGREMSTKDLAKMEKVLKTNKEKSEKIEKEKKTLKLEVDQLKQELDLAEMKHKSETESLRNSEARLRNKVEGLEQKNQSLLDMLDKSASTALINAGKQKDFELFKEITNREIKWYSDQHQFLTEYIESDRSAMHKKELADLRDKLASLSVELEQMKATEKSLIANEESDDPQLRPRRESHGSDQGYETELAKLKASLAEQTDVLKQRKKEKVDILSGMDKEAVMQAFLQTEADELVIRARQHELELEEESRAVREELSRLKRDSAAKEHKYKEVLASIEALKLKDVKLEEDLQLVQQKMDTYNKHAMASGDSKKEKSGEDMKIVESLQIEKKSLRGDIESMSRQKAKLEQTANQQNNKLLIVQENILYLASRICQHENIDVEAISKSLTEEEKDRAINAVQKKSPFDMRLLIEKLSTENLELSRRLRLLQARTLMKSQRS